MAQILNFNSDFDGLSSKAAEEQLGMYGLNLDCGDGEKRLRPAAFLLNPRFFLMAGAAVLSVLADEILGACVMALLTLIFVFSEVFKSIRLGEKLGGLQRMSGMKFRVLRNGSLTLVRKEYLVPDDIIVLQGGEQVPADAHILECENVAADEAIFTGSHIPVVKNAGVSADKTLPKTSCVYKNTIVLTGTLVARIFATGEDVARKSGHNADPETEFEKAVRRFTPAFYAAAIVMLVISGIFSVLGIDKAAENYVMSVSAALLNSIAFALCFVPAETATLVRIYYISGATRLAQKNALVKDLRVMESMNALTCVCVEKTGTITKNHLEVAEEYTDNKDMFLNIAVLACEKAPTAPLEQAIMLYATFGGADVKGLQSNERLASYPFSERTKIAGNLWDIGGSKLLCIKGSPEAVLTLCDVDNDRLHFIQRKQHEFSAGGNQVLAVAFSQMTDGAIPDSLYGISFTYIGLLAFTNQTKDTIPYAVKSCYKAGVNVIMTTGDSEETALAIARRIGLRDGKIITGDQLRDFELSDETPDFSGVNIFARVTPEQRREIVRMLQKQGEIVAMAGDDLEDTEVLRQADVGVAVTSGACPAAHEACDLLMSDENFIAVVDAVKESRQVHRNVKRCIQTVLSAQTALILFSLFCVLTGIESVLTPALLSVLSVLVVPACGMFFLDNTSELKSEFVSSGFIGRGKINRAFFPKALICGATLAAGMILFRLMSAGLPAAAARSLILFMFATGLSVQSMTQLSEKRSLIEVFREKKSGFFGLFLSGIIFLAALVLIYIPFINTAFGLGSVNLLVLLIALLVTLLFNGWFEIVKYLRKNR